MSGKGGCRSLLREALAERRSSDIPEVRPMPAAESRRPARPGSLRRSRLRVSQALREASRARLLSTLTHVRLARQARVGRAPLSWMGRVSARRRASRGPPARSAARSRRLDDDVKARRRVSWIVRRSYRSPAGGRAGPHVYWPDHPDVLARPGPGHEHDVAVLTCSLLVYSAGLRFRAPLVQVAQVGPREQVTGLPEPRPDGSTGWTPRLPDTCGRPVAPRGSRRQGAPGGHADQPLTRSARRGSWKRARRSMMASRPPTAGRPNICDESGDP